MVTVAASSTQQHQLQKQTSSYSSWRLNKTLRIKMVYHNTAAALCCSRRLLLWWGAATYSCSGDARMMDCSTACSTGLFYRVCCFLEALGFHSLRLQQAGHTAGHGVEC